MFRRGLWTVSLVLLCVSMNADSGAAAAPGDWPEPRQNPQLTAFQPLPGRLREAPQVLAQFDLGRSQPALQAVPLLGGSGHAGLGIVAGAAYCYDTAGKGLWQSHPPGLNFTRIVSAEDLDGDGQSEVLLAAGRSADPYGAAVLLSLTDGRVLWRYDVEPMSYSWYLFTGKYLPDTKTQQIIVLMHGYPPDKKNGYIALFAFPEGGGTPAQRWRYDFDQYTCFPTLLQSDLDGDGVKEVVIETHSRMWFLDAQTGLVKHFAQWDVAPANVRSYGLVEFLDLNGDAREDFLCIANFAQHHEVLLNRDGKMEKAWHYGWPESVTTGKVATAWPEPPYADLDGGGLEIVVSVYNSENENAWLVRVYDAITGALKYRFPGLVAERCADVDGDGRAEVLCNATTDPTRNQQHGARLLKVVEGELKIVWQEDAATALNGRKDGMRVRRGDETFLLRLNAEYQAQFEPWTKPAKIKVADFSAAPAVQGPAFPLLLAADMDGDARNEVLLYRDDRVQTFRFEGGSLTPGNEYKSSSVPVIADLDGDGNSELVLSTVSAAGPPVVEAVTPALENRALWQTVFPDPGRPGLPQPRTAYLRTLRATGKPTPDIYVWAGTPVVRSAVLEGGTGRMFWDKGETPGLERYWGPSVNYAAVCDFNADGHEDLVFTNPDYYCVADGPTGNPLFGPAFPPEIFKQPCQGLYTYPAILQEREGESTVCLVAGHYFQAAMSLHASPYWYVIPEPGENRCASEAFLQLGNGAWLMGFGRQNGCFACVEARSGRVRWELPVEASCSDAAAGDVDGEGQPEFVFGTSHGQLYAVGDGGEAPRLLWKADIGAGLGSPLLADIDGDGFIEITCASADGYVSVLGTRKNL